MHWFFGTLIGALTLVTLNTLERMNGMSNLKMYLIIMPLLFLCNQGFWYGFHNAPNFIQVWFLGSAMTALLGWLSHIFILREPVLLAHIIGFALIFIGAFLLVTKG